ncbi:MAG: hypothetical protein JXA43_03550 [Candidatus Diapherotrites archaeon]|nr:hypothetical protein [Candidatus Diapherotrites archaeon]
MQDSKWSCAVIVAIILLVLFFMYGFQTSNNATDGITEEAKDACMLLCKTVNYSKAEGPCLSNDIAPGWVCDIAHNPRAEMDDWPENQCSAYVSGKAKHFVEVTPDCKFIRAN